MKRERTGIDQHTEIHVALIAIDIDRAIATDFRRSADRTWKSGATRRELLVENKSCNKRSTVCDETSEAVRGDK